MMLLLRKKRSESSESWPDEPELFLDAVMEFSAQLYAADHVWCATYVLLPHTDLFQGLAQISKHVGR